ncbi:hypothetical protein KR215_010079, partial [Drosophila sulfurigaster]
ADAHYQALREKRRILKSLIKSSKRKMFLELCDEADADPWGSAYKLAMKKLHAFRPACPTCPELLAKTVAHLFPSQPRSAYGMATDTSTFAQVTEDEVLSAARLIKPGKAPGPDGIP